MKEENKKDMLKRLLFIAKKLSEKTKEQSFKKLVQKRSHY